MTLSAGAAGSSGRGTMTEDRDPAGADPFAAAGTLLGYAIAAIVILILVYAAIGR